MQQLTGNLRGLAVSEKRQCEKLFRRKVDVEDVASRDLFRELAGLSGSLGRQIGVLINRRGKVTDVIVGTRERVVIPELGRLREEGSRFRGLRLIHTHLADKDLDTEDLADLTLLRLDMICAVTVLPDGLPGPVYIAHLAPRTGSEYDKDKGFWERLKFRHPSDIDLPFLRTMRALEEEFQYTRASLSNGKPEGLKALLVVLGDQAVHKRHGDELSRLAAAADYYPVGVISQNPRGKTSRYLVGKGKVTELFFEGLHRGADVIIFNRELSPSQTFALQQATDLRIVDRTQVILEIFSKRARSKGGKLQVELATLRYELPRLKGRGVEMSRLGGGIGTRGPGEKKIEVERRDLKRRITALESEIKKLSRKRSLNRAVRQRKQVPVISLIGYTNTGKSTLLNVLTKSSVVAENKLFATLDPTSRRLRFPREREVVITDTVGFIRDMPGELLRAFQATFEELFHANLFVNILDASDPEVHAQEKIVKEILEEMGLENVPFLNVLNKSDLVSGEEIGKLKAVFNAPAVSAKDGDSLHPMLESVERILWGEENVQ